MTNSDISAPVISNLSAYVLPTNNDANSVSISLTGLFFGLVDDSPQVRMGLTSCEVSTWLSDTAVLCKAPSGAGASISLVVSLHASKGLQSLLNVSYHAPNVSSISPSAVPAISVPQVTVTGSSFGNGQYDQQVITSDFTCVSTLYISDSSLVCSRPRGFGTASVSVVVSEQRSNVLAQSLEFNKPAISSFSPMNGPKQSGIVVSVFGTDFGYADSSIRISMGSTFCSATDWVSESTLLCKLLGGTGRTVAPVSVSSLGLATAALFFSYDDPEIATFAPLTVSRQGGTLLSLFGRNFGPPPGVVSSLTVGQSACGPVAFVSDTSLYCIAAGGVGGKLQILIGFDFGTRAVNTSLQYNPPFLVRAQPPVSPASGGSTIVFSGFLFGSTDPTPVASIGDTICVSTRWTSDSSLSCVSATGVGGALKLSVNVYESVATSEPLFSYSAPQVQAFSPPLARFDGGTTVTISGQNYGILDSTVAVRVGQSGVVSRWISDTMIVCRSPVTQQPSSSSIVLVTVQRQIGASQFPLYHVSFPFIRDVSRKNSPGVGGVLSTLTGTGFGLVDSSPSASVGATACVATSWQSASSIVCTIPPGRGRFLSTSFSLPLTPTPLVTVLGSSFSFDQPIVSSVTPSAVRTVGNSRITLFGKNFGASTPSSFRVFVGDSQCVSEQWSSDSSIQCSTVAGAGRSLPIIASFSDSLPSDAFNGFSYRAPVVNSVAPGQFGTNGASVTIIGDNFGQNSSFVVVRSTIGDTRMSLSFSNHSTILAQLGPVGFRPSTFAVDVRGQISTFAGSYSTLSISSIIPTQIAGAGGTLITLFGTSFGGLDSSPVARIGFTDASWTQWVSDSSAVAKSSRGSGLLTSVTLSIARQQSNLTDSVRFVIRSCEEVAQTAQSSQLISAFYNFDEVANTSSSLSLYCDFQSLLMGFARLLPPSIGESRSFQWLTT